MEISEPSVMFTYISWFTALRKKRSVSTLRSVSQELQGIEGSYLALTYILGRPTEISDPYLNLTLYFMVHCTYRAEPYLTLTYISWFTALRKKSSASAIRSVFQ